MVGGAHDRGGPRRARGGEDPVRAALLAAAGPGRLAHPRGRPPAGHRVSGRGPRGAARADAGRSLGDARTVQAPCADARRAHRGDPGRAGLRKGADRRAQDAQGHLTGGRTVSALAVRSLTKSFGGLRVTSSVDLVVEPGERRLIIGPNGAGKTTLFNLITGELKPDGGSVSLFDRDITRVPSRRRFHMGIARTYEIITLFPGETLLRNVTLALLGRSRRRWNPFVRLSRQASLATAAREILARVGLEHLADRPLAQTSYGERRRVEVAMALAQNPRVLLLDEPFAGLSIDERRDVLRLVTTIPRDVTIVMIEHDMDVALDFAERITVLHFGEVVVEGTRGDVVAHPRTREIYLGE